MEPDLPDHLAKLIGTQSTDEKTREEASSYVSNLLANDCPNLYRLSCSTILSNESPIQAVKLSYILIWQSSFFLLHNWKGFLPDQRNRMKDAILRGLFLPDQSIRDLAAHALCLIGQCDIPFGFQNDIFQVLSTPICNQQYQPCCTIGCFVALKELVLQNLLSPEYPNYFNSGQTISHAYNFIMSNFTVFEVIDFIDFLKSFSVILPFYKEFFHNADTRNEMLNLMNNVFSTMQKPVHDALYDLLIEIFYCFYDDILNNMANIFGITSNSLVLFNNPDLIYPAILFWHKVAKFEIQRVKFIQNRMNKKHNIIYLGVVEKSSPNLVNPFLAIIYKFTTEVIEEDNFNDINLCEVASDCLRKFSALTSNVFDQLTPYFKEKIASTDWKERQSALYAIWCMSKHQTHDINISREENVKITFSLTNFYQTIALTEVMKCFNDDHVANKVLSLSILEVIFRLSAEISQNIHQIRSIKVFFNQAFYDQKVLRTDIPSIIAGKICDIIRSIAKHNKKKQSEGFCTFYSDFVNLLFLVFHRNDIIDPILGFKCTETICQLFSAAPDDMCGLLIEKLQEILSFLQRIFDNKEQLFENGSDVQQHIKQCCVIIFSVVKRMGPGIAPHCESIMNCLLRCLTMKSIIIQEEALISLTAMIRSLQSSIQLYIPQIVEIFELSQESGISEIIESSAYTITNLYKCVTSEMIIYNQRVFSRLFTQVQDQNLILKTRISLLFAIGNIISFLGISSEPFLTPFAIQLSHYLSIPINPLYSGDIENCSNTYPILLDGFYILFEVSQNLPFFVEYIKNFKEVMKIFDNISKYPQMMTQNMAISSLKLIHIILSNIEIICSISQRIRALMHGRKIKGIVQLIMKSNYENEINEFAHDVFDMLNRC
ncbi:hypothetical protein TRFO_18448 [Tritrichomonas foetus]|uniref:Importin subunit beta-1/Transportin-1-like TPR repeats domain-containing protein n=1 Tax=Tritrichomonas foetus TaxID=1144522 RepID=A0A1J4KLR6_9EUKA|nr:hypothetical protein TRFO_18448 [Tritrichomonas foetus]|eukprot:OHT11880.1 hypothetical protein TRFO_18448 [Tritrichomonas foetus]